jgi:hypothetical protein
MKEDESRAVFRFLVLERMLSKVSFKIQNQCCGARAARRCTNMVKPEPCGVGSAPAPINKDRYLKKYHEIMESIFNVFNAHVLYINRRESN